MIRWLAGRTAQAATTFVVAVVLMFFLMRLSPGDPLARLVGDRQVSAAELASLRTRFGLDQPLLTQFRAFLGGVASGDLGASIEYYPTPVTELLASRLPATLLLGGTVLVVNFTLGILIGVWQARRRGTAGDRWVSILSLTAFALPSFWLGLILAWLFGIHWHLLPTTGTITLTLDPNAGLVTRAADVARHLILPAATLCTITIAVTIRHQRSAMIETLTADYVRTARAKGLSENVVVWRHAWRNAMSPVLTLFGLWLPALVTGSVFVESVFSWHGLGSLAADAILARDYPLIMGTAVLVAGAVVAGTWLSDVLHMALDPRVRA